MNRGNAQASILGYRAVAAIAYYDAAIAIQERLRAALGGYFGAVAQRPGRSLFQQSAGAAVLKDRARAGDDPQRALGLWARTCGRGGRRTMERDGVPRQRARGVGGNHDAEQKPK
jgi:hypothetical protein